MVRFHVIENRRCSAFNFFFNEGSCLVSKSRLLIEMDNLYEEVRATRPDPAKVPFLNNTTFMRGSVLICISKKRKWQGKYFGGKYSPNNFRDVFQLLPCTTTATNIKYIAWKLIYVVSLCVVLVQ